MIRSAGGSVADPNLRLAVFLYSYGLILLACFIILASQKGMPAPNEEQQPCPP